MSIILRHDTPAVAAAIAAGVGTDQGRALVDRAIFIEEQRIKDAMFQRATARPADANPVSTAPVMRRLGDGMRPPQQRTAGGFPARAAAPTQTFGRAQPAPQQPPTAGRQAPGPAGPAPAPVAAPAPQIAAAPAPKPLKTPGEFTASRKATGNQKRDAAATLAGTLPPGVIARMVRPAFEAGPDNQDGDPRIEAESNKARALAASTLQAIDDMPHERANDGMRLYSLPDLIDRIEQFEAAGVPKHALDTAKRAADDLVKDVVNAARALQHSAGRAEQESAMRGLDPEASDAVIAQAVAEAAATVGMTPDQLLDSMDFLESNGVQVRKQRQQLVSSPVPGQPGVTEVRPATQPLR